jgi:hypothetical protein
MASSATVASARRGVIHRRGRGEARDMVARIFRG